MEELEIPIFKKSYELCKLSYSYRDTIPKQDRYTIWQKCENLLLELLEGILEASSIPKSQKLPTLEHTSRKLNLLKVFFRLAKDVKAIDNKKYIALQESADEIGRMLGGWIKSTKN